MAMEISSAYNNVYEGAYAAQKQETVKKQAVSNRETDTVKRTNDVKSAYETKTSASQTTEEYLSNLRQKYSNVNITVADFSSDKQLKSYMFSCGGGKNIAISSSIIEKMASNPATAAKYEKVIADVPNAANEIKEGVEATGSELLACGTVIDKNGKVSYWCIGRKKETVENPGTVYKEKVQKQLKEKREEKLEQEKVQEKKDEKIKIQEKQQEVRMAEAESAEELLDKFVTNETKDMSEICLKGVKVDYSV